MVRAVAVAAVAALALASTASAQQFNNGIPAGWTCTGTCGTSTANGDVPLAPGGGTQYGWVSTANSQEEGINLPGVGGSGEATNGSRLRSVVFNATAGDMLSFKFNFVTSDGSGFADYAWARLLDGSGNPLTTVFTARTTPEGNTVPGFGMPALPPGVTLNPSTVTINPGATNWAPLGNSSGSCFNGVGNGCGNTGWVNSTFTIGATGQFIMEFGVTNWNDTAFDSGLAFDGLSVNGIIIGPPPTSTVPEPTTIALVATGLAAVGAVSRRRRAA